MGDIFDIQCSFKTIRLDDNGIYQFNVEQAMRHGDLAKIEHLPSLTSIKQEGLLQIVSLLDTLEEHKVDAAMGGARRDEEKAKYFF
ncbi:hypothetical protein N9Y26_00820 [bacterium]|nr:hypothetical protein [bacterium]MDB2651823.1 hypothetical protein [bacterium]